MTKKTPSPMSTQHTMTGNEIYQALGIESSFGDAARRARAVSQSRTIYRLTKQWPWEWASDFPPQSWTPNMVYSLARVVRHVAYGTFEVTSPEDKPDLDDLKIYIRNRANLRGGNAPLRPSDITDEIEHFEVTRNKPEPTAEEKSPVPCGSGPVDVEDEDDQKSEEDDNKDVIDSTTEGKQHESVGGAKDGFDKINDGQTSTSSKATASPVPILNSPDRVPIHQNLARRTKSSLPEGTTTRNNATPSPSASIKKHARAEETSPNPAVGTPGRPAKTRRLNVDESIANPDHSAPTAKDAAATTTKEEDWATLRTLVKRRQTQSSLDYMALEEEVDTFQDEREARKVSLEAGTIVAAASWSELVIREKVRDDADNNIQKFRRTVKDYLANKDLLETLDLETRTLVTKDHKRRLGEMEKELDSAVTHLQDARRKVEAECEGVKQRIKEDEARLVDMEADLELAHAEHNRWRCMGHLAVMKSHDLKRVMVGLEKEGLGPSKCSEKEDQFDRGIESPNKSNTDPDATESG